MLSLYEWSARSGTQENVEYAPGEKVGPSIYVEGKQYSLIALPRFYSRDEVLDFHTSRISRGTFLGDRESVGIESIDATALLVMTVVWPATRPPECVRHRWVSASGDRQVQEVPLENKEGRPTLAIRVREPEKGSLNEIEWDWPVQPGEADVPTQPSSRLALLLSADRRRRSRL